jgi:hypothetical protein
MLSVYLRDVPCMDSFIAVVNWPYDTKMWATTHRIGFICLAWELYRGKHSWCVNTSVLSVVHSTISCTIINCPATHVSRWWNLKEKNIIFFKKFKRQWNETLCMTLMQIETRTGWHSLLNDMQINET